MLTKIRILIKSDISGHYRSVNVMPIWIVFMGKQRQGQTGYETVELKLMNCLLIVSPFLFSKSINVEPACGGFKRVQNIQNDLIGITDKQGSLPYRWLCLWAGGKDILLILFQQLGVIQLCIQDCHWIWILVCSRTPVNIKNMIDLYCIENIRDGKEINLLK